MKTKEIYNAPEMEQITLGLELGILVVSGADSASNGYDPNNNLGGLGDEDGD